MWTWLASRILRNRIGILVVLALITAFMAWKMGQVKYSYKFGGLLPQSDSTYIAYQEFLSHFSEDGNVIVFGVQDPDIYKLENFNAWYQLGVDLKAMNGVDSIFSEAHLFNLVRNDQEKRFQLLPLNSGQLSSQSDLDSLMRKVRSLPFYRGLLYNEQTGASLMMVFVNADLFNSEARGDVVERISERVDQFAEGRMQVYRSGLPFIRSTVTKRTKSELNMFVGMTVGVTALLLLLFFRSFRVMLFCMLVVSIAVVWSLGTIALFDYELTSVMAIIPPLIIVIGVPNCIFLLNKYFQEYLKHGNQMRAISRMIERTGKAAFLTNMTTALGFATFMLTYSDVLKQFGVIASLNIMAVFVISLLIIPIMFSFQKAPKARHTKHLERRWMDLTTDTLIRFVRYYRPAIYVGASALFIFGLVGVGRLNNESRIVDDLPHTDLIMTDLKFFEENFKGVMPLEILIDTKKRGQAMKGVNLKKITQMQDSLAKFPELSRSISIADAVKFTKQAFYGGDPARYDLLTGSERSFILPYVDGAKKADGLATAFLDSARQTTRVTMQVADVGTQKMDALMARLRQQVDSIFDPGKYKVTLTGTSVVFLEGTKYMVSNLIISLAIAVVLISLVMALLFNSFRMVIVSLIPNLIPLVTTAGLMGYLGIPIKPSTILVFSIAFGISVDDAIHYLAKYRQELKLNKHNIRIAVFQAIREAGVSMIYTSIVLFFGFSLFVFSDFGGIQALGVLISLTLLVAMFTNLLILPALLITFEGSMTTKAFEEPLLDILDEEDDINVSEIKVTNKIEKP